MIIRQKSLIHILKGIKILNGILVGLLLVPLSFFFFYSLSENQIETLNADVLNRPRECSSPFDHTVIGKGPLALSSGLQSFPFPDLSGEIIFFGKNTRPDVAPFEVKLQIGLKGSGNSLIVSPGQKVYLAYDADRLNFSEVVTPLWIRPKLDASGVGVLEMGIQLLSGQGETLLDEMREFKVEWESKPIEEATDHAFKLGSEILKMGQWWGPDVLYGRYGGDAFDQYKGKERIAIQTEGGKQILFAKEGDTFIWRDNQWAYSLETRGFPMAKVMAISSYQIEWKLWSTEGMESVSIFFEKERSCPISMRMEDVFSRLRRRTASRVSCRIDNRAALLKEGDWLVHTLTGWHTIKSREEVEALLSFDVIGDLFIFDGLKKTDGKEVFCGTLFNPIRTEYQYVRLPMTQIRNRKHSSPTKNLFSTKISSLGNEGFSRDRALGSSSQNVIREEDDIFDED